MQLLADLTFPKEVLPIVVEVRPHEPRIVFSRRGLEGTKIEPICLAALIKRYVPERGSVLFGSGEKFSQKRDVYLLRSRGVSST